ncbi:MAG: glycosyltransferase family 4 protein, partial [Anaerolineae bacterium]|nr:glycosyltransferase family 4 protein [Anaerolineae bacterium]
MRVYMVEASAKGGLIHYAYQLCRGLQRSGIDTTLITSTHYELRDLPHEFQVNTFLKLWDPRGPKAGNPLWRVARRGLRGVQYVIEWGRLVRLLRREKPDVVLFGEMRFPFEVYFLRVLRRAGLVLADIVHDVQPYNTSRRSGQVVATGAELAGFERIYREFDALFVHDRSNYERFLDLYTVEPARVHQIFLPADELMLEIPPDITPEALRARFGVTPGQPVLLFFGTITKYKGLEDLLRALPQVVAEVPDVRLIVAGFPAKDVDSAALRAIVT